MNLKGVIPAVTTPFDERGRLAAARLEENLARWNEVGLAGYLVLGSTGENVYLNDQERSEVVRAARRAIPVGLTMIVGVGHEATEQAIAFVREVADLGADAVIVGAPHYYRDQMNDTVLYEHYMRVADASPLPVLLYSVPQFTGLALGPRLVARLAKHERIIAIKDSSGNIAALAEMIRLAPRGFQVLTGHPLVFFPALCAGAAGAVLAIACAAPGICVEIYRAFEAEDFVRARELQFRLAQAAAPINSIYGIAGLKAAMDIAGYYGGPPRAPLLPLGREEHEQLKRLLIDALISSESP